MHINRIKIMYYNDELREFLNTLPKFEIELLLQQMKVDRVNYISASKNNGNYVWAEYGAPYLVQVNGVIEELESALLKIKYLDK